MGRFNTGSEAAAYVYSTVIPLIKECAKSLPSTGKQARLAAQIDCVMGKFK